jgi:hypothetical protein
VLGGAALLIAAGVLATRPWRATQPDSSSAPQTEPMPEAQLPAPAPPAADVPPAAAPAAAAGESGIHAEMTIERRVWVRVLVDGQNVLERELEEDDRVPIQASRSLVIRTGDAGAVRLAIDGQDRGLLGRDGEVVTRTFTPRRTTR